MDLGLEGRPALVAAASRGLGRACALSLAGEGARVAICGRDPERLEETREEITRTTGSEVVAVRADVSVADDARRFVGEAVDALGGCEILVTNAGGPPTGRFDELPEDRLEDAVQANFLSATRMAREALPPMREAGYGRIVAITSIGAKQPIPRLVLSNATRAAVLAWAKTLSDEVAPEGITVNAVLPDRVLTDRVRDLLGQEASREGRSVEEAMEEAQRSTPVGRFGEPRELGDLVAYLCSERAGFLTGCFIQVDGGRYRGLF